MINPEFDAEPDALRSALANATSVQLMSIFDDTVLSKVIQPPRWTSVLVSHLQTVATAALCGAFAMALLMQIVVQPINPSLASKNYKRINMDKLMLLIDKQGQTIASLTLLQESIQQANSTITSPYKFEVPPKIDGRIAIPQVVV